MERRRNPDVISNITTLAVVGALGFVAYEIASIKIPSLSLPSWGQILPNIPNVFNPGAAVRNAVIGDPSVILNNAIDAWFNNAGGFFGIGAYDPTNYQSMIDGTNRIALMPVAFPSSPPSYFLTKSADWAQSHQVSKPYGS
jgi:hypothetical protein